MILDNTALKQDFQNWLHTQIKSLPATPVLDIIQIGDDFASNKYIQTKKNIAQKIGISVVLHKFAIDVDPTIVQQAIDQANHNRHGLIIQLPVLSNFAPLVHNLNPSIDVDMLGYRSFEMWEKGFLPPTIGAIDLTLKFILKIEKGNNFESFISNRLDLSDKTVAIVGRGKLVGTPAIRYFLDRQATLISIDKNTKNPKQLTKQADIIITATGQPGLIDQSWVRSGSIVIDAATSESNNSIVGDVNIDKMPDDVLISPSPGGIGKVTVLYLFYNLLKSKTNCTKI